MKCRSYKQQICAQLACIITTVYTIIEFIKFVRNIINSSTNRFRLISFSTFWCHFTMLQE